MEEDFLENYQSNYLKAREVVGKELIIKHGFVESYRDDERLTLDSTNYSFHLTFHPMEGKNLYVTLKGDLPHTKDTFLAYIYNFAGKDIEKTKSLSSEIYKSIKGTKREDLSSLNTLIKSYRCQLIFLEENLADLYT